MPALLSGACIFKCIVLYLRAMSGRSLLTTTCGPCFPKPFCASHTVLSALQTGLPMFVIITGTHNSAKCPLFIDEETEAQS